MNQTMPITVLDLRSMALLLAGLALIAAPHFLHLPLWIAVVAIALGVWRWWAAISNRRLPGLVIKLLITATAIAAIFAQFGTVTGRDAGVALLVMMMGLKLLEMRQRRDVMVLLLLGYFILVTHFLYNQSIPMLMYILIATWLLLSLHIHLSRYRPPLFRHSLRTAGILLIQALPLMLVLFVLFPRVPGPIWGLPNDAYAGMSGLDDSMNPGSISQLSQSDAVAFRVEFNGPLPANELRYWRGPVLTLTDGRSWGSGDNEPFRQRQYNFMPLEAKEYATSYSVTLEPHNRQWLFALDLPTTPPSMAAITSDFQLKFDKKVRERLRYTMTSYLQYNTGAITPFERQTTLSLPRDRNPRTVEQGQMLRRSLNSDEAIIQRALDMYRTQPFVYSLRPPLLRSEHPSDEFLFETQKGFCEHFASSFTMLMRAAGIPARVVTGYQGGEINPVDGYLIVRQRDAHAWSEVWLDGKGWLRVDPTAAVAPERIERSIDTVSQNIGDAVRFDLPQSGVLLNAWQQLRFSIDALNNTWNQWVLGYGPEQQRSFLELLGVHIDSWVDIAKTLVIAIIISVLLLSALIMLPRKQTIDPVQASYQRFCRKLARRGLVHQDNESATNYAQRIAAKRPELKSRVDAISMLYNRLRYAPTAQPQQLDRLKLLIASFKP